MTWWIYIVAVLGTGYCLSTLFSGEKKNFFIIFCLVILLIPAQIEVNTDYYAPALYTFLFNVVLEKNFSLRPLRPILLGLPISLLLIWIVSILKKRFF